MNTACGSTSRRPWQGFFKIQDLTPTLRRIAGEPAGHGRVGRNESRRVLGAFLQHPVGGLPEQLPPLRRRGVQLVRHRLRRHVTDRVAEVALRLRVAHPGFGGFDLVRRRRVRRPTAD